MSAHVAVPGLTGDPTLPATLSRTVMRGTLRDDLGFGGLTISDALDMHALAQGAAQAVEIIAAVRAGIDLLLCAPGRPAQRRVEETLRAAAARGLFESDELEASSARLADLRAWLAAAGSPPDLDVVGSADHLAISRELAERALTRLDRGPAGTEPPAIAFAPGMRILAIMPEPTDLTPADTSSVVPPGLGRALRTRFASVDDVVVPVAPSDVEIAGLRARAGTFDAVVVGTIEAHRQPAQAALVRAIAETGTPTVAVAMRTPWDALVYPAGIPAIATYSILPEPLEALARALAGEIGFPGRLPVALEAGATTAARR
jgi:beta-N-acetylhexosaminidase